MLRRFAVSLLALLLPLPTLAQIPPPPEGAECAEIPTWDSKKPLKKPPPFKGNQIVAGPEGYVAVEVREVYALCKAGKEKKVFAGIGMRNAQGKVVVPYRYDEVMPTSPNGAVVHSMERGFATYTLGKGEKPLPVRPYMTRATDDYGSCNNGRLPGGRGPNIVTIMAAPEKSTDPMKNLIFFGSEEPVVLQNTAGIPRRVDRLLYVGGYASDHTQVSRVYDLYGRPVSGTLGKIFFWHSARNEVTLSTCERGLPDMLAAGPSLDRDPAVARIGPIYFPINRDGTFYPMPEGALGVFPLRGLADDLPFARIANEHRDHVADHWGVVYSDPEGWSFSLHRGKPLDAISSATGLEPRYRNFVRDAETGMFAAQDVRDGRWQVFQVGALQPMQLSGSFTSGETALATVKREIAEAQAAYAERERVRREEEVAIRREQMLKTLAEAKAAGRLCQYVPQFELGAEHISDFADQCPHKLNISDLAAAEAMGMSPTLSAKVREYWDRAAKAQHLAFLQQEEARRNPLPMPYVPGAWSDAIRAAGDRAIADSNARSSAWFEQRRKAYRDEWQRKQRAY